MLQCESAYKSVLWSHTTHILVYRIYIRLGVLKSLMQMICAKFFVYRYV